MVKLIFGCGYLGKHVAERWRTDGHRVIIVTRSTDRSEQFVQRGYEAIVADVTELSTLQLLPPADTVLFAVGFDRSSDKSIMDIYAGGVRNVLNALPSDTGRFVYISSTGVYGPAGGEWVDETTPTDPQREGGRASLAAERAIYSHPFAARSVVLRLAGIYGPGRVPFLNDLQAGAPIAAPREGFLNLIHVDDAASVVLATSNSVAMTDEGEPQLYCVSDGNPVKRHDFYREVARLTGSPEPQFVEPDSTSPRAERARGNRRVSNGKMLRELNVSLSYSDYRSGLAAILETENQ
jgi:nucleoside-diphosphate-sugar epimerase